MTSTVTVSKWGNASGIRIPKLFCEQIGLSIGDHVSLSLVDNRIIIEGQHARHTLEERLQTWDGKVLEAREYDWGTPVGKEMW